FRDQVNPGDGREDRRVLDECRKFVAKGWEAQAKRLRQDDVPHALPRPEPEGLGCLDLSFRNRLKARATDFSLVRGGVHPNRNGGNSHWDIPASVPREESVEDRLGYVRC